MPSRVKELIVAETVEHYRAAGGVVAVDIPPVPGIETTEFREGFRAKNVSFRVVKNTLAKVAFGELGGNEFADMLEGRIALISAEDVVEASKAAEELVKELKFTVKGGWGDGKALTPAEVKTLSKIPSKKALFAQIAGLATAPLRGLVGMIGAPGASLARVMKAWNEKREEAGESGGSEAVEAQ